MKRDHDRNNIIDYLLANLFRAYLMIYDKQWQEAFMVIFANVTVIDIFNEFILNIKHRMILVLLLYKLEARDQAGQLLEMLKHLVEDTNNNKEAILIYEQIGKKYQDDKNYEDALRAFKRMLQIAWTEND
mgnify:CR=1 FL=1